MSLPRILPRYSRRLLQTPLANKLHSNIPPSAKSYSPAMQKIPGFSESDGQFRRKPSAFRNFISADPSSAFPAEPNRYALYIHLGCPWAHRTNIVRSLKCLEDIIQLIVLDDAEIKDGKMMWCFAGEKKDPLYGFKYLKDLYEKSEPGYDGRYLVPTLWDKKTGIDAPLAPRAVQQECVLIPEQRRS